MKILDILPIRGSLGADVFRAKYQVMPNDYSFHILVTGDIAFDGQKFANARLHVQAPPSKWTRWRKICQALALAIRAIRLARQEKVDVIVCYDPLTLGIAGVLAKLFSGARLVIEINGHIRNAEAASLGQGRAGKLKRAVYNAVGTMTLSIADCVKLLNEKQYEEWKSVLSKKPVVIFHDFVPTGQFIVTGEDEQYVYCLGHPFYLKGVDVLIKAFGSIAQEFPDYRLVIMGHCRSWELAQWKAQIAMIERAEIHPPVPESEVATHLSRCSILVNPSRSEAMGRVFIEAMASGKACIGTRVGGIPNIIADGVSGYLVEPEDVTGLAEKMRLLLADRPRRARMGMAGKRITQTILSSERYALHYERMIGLMFNDNSTGTGICFNGYVDTGLGGGLQ